MSNIRERFEKLCKDIAAGTRVQVYGQDAILIFFRQELLALAEEVKPIELKHIECASGQAAACEDCLGRMNINVGIIKASTLIRSKADSMLE